MAKKNKTEEYIEVIQPLGYMNDREISNIGGNYLVSGSQNVIIENKEKVSSRKGYTLVGAAKTNNNPIEGSFDWYTSSGAWRNLRSHGKLLEYYKDGSWLTLLSDLYSAKVRFAPWWSPTELIDILLFVVGDDSVKEWSGGIAEVASVTTNTITKKGYLAGATIAFNENGASSDTITDSGNGFVTAGFAAGDEIIISGSASNDGVYTIASVTAGTITLIDTDDLTAEVAGASVVVKWSKFGSWAEARFFTAGTRKVLIDGVEYTYTGGETTGTLTGVTGDPSAGGVVAGDLAVQAVRNNTPAYLDGFKNDLIGVVNNHVLIGSSTSRIVYVSTSTDFTSNTYSTPRAPGEGFELTLDSAPTAFVVDEDVMKISGGRDDWYKIEMILSADQTGETITVRKLKTATGQAAISQDAVIKIKNNIAFISFEPTIDTLGRVENIEGPETTPISDDIKKDIESYDLTNAHGLYAVRNMYIALPAEGKMIIYDLQDRLWQPPQTIPVRRLALIDIDGDGIVRLCGHSAHGNETYRLFYGYNDNGVSFKAVAAFGYDDFASRFSKKQFDEIGTEVKMSENTILKVIVNYDYKGFTGIKEKTIDGASDVGRFTPVVLGGLGQNPLGFAPFGGMGTDTEDLNKYKKIHEVPLLDFYERQRVFESDSEDLRFEILAYGENVSLSENLPVELKE